MKKRGIDASDYSLNKRDKRTTLINCTADKRGPNWCRAPLTRHRRSRENYVHRVHGGAAFEKNAGRVDKCGEVRRFRAENCYPTLRLRSTSIIYRLESRSLKLLFHPVSLRPGDVRVYGGGSFFFNST